MLYFLESNYLQWVMDTNIHFLLNTMVVRTEYKIVHSSAVLQVLLMDSWNGLGDNPTPPHPPNPYIEVLIPSISELDLIWKKDLQRDD